METIRSAGLHAASIQPSGDVTQRQLARVRVAGRASAVVARRTLRKAVRKPTDPFLGTVAHELRNSLMPLTMCLPLLESAAVETPNTPDIHAIMARQIGRMNRLVDDVLDVARLGYGKVHLESLPLELNELVRAIVDEHRAQFEHRGVELRVVESSEQLYVTGDPVRLAQVLVNLLQNALKFTDRDGLVSLSLSVEEEHAVIKVRDSGTGMTPEALSRVFTPFAQVESSLHRNRTGLGLGLYVVKALVDLHGGTVEATSPGLTLGSEFCVRLPLAQNLP